MIGAFRLVIIARVCVFEGSIEGEDRFNRSGVGSSAACTLPMHRLCCRRGAQRGMPVLEGS